MHELYAIVACSKCSLNGLSAVITGHCTLRRATAELDAVSISDRPNPVCLAEEPIYPPFTIQQLLHTDSLYTFPRDIRGRAKAYTGRLKKGDFYMRTVQGHASIDRTCAFGSYVMRGPVRGEVLASVSARTTIVCR